MIVQTLSSWVPEGIRLAFRCLTGFMCSSVCLRVVFVFFIAVSCGVRLLMKRLVRCLFGIVLFYVFCLGSRGVDENSFGFLRNSGKGDVPILSRMFMDKRRGRGKLPRSIHYLSMLAPCSGSRLLLLRLHRFISWMVLDVGKVWPQRTIFGRIDRDTWRLKHRFQ